jgi:hypothetical protein
MNQNEINALRREVLNGVSMKSLAEQSGTPIGEFTAMIGAAVREKAKVNELRRREARDAKIESLLVQTDLSFARIAEQCSCSITLVQRAARKLGIRRRNAIETEDSVMSMIDAHWMEHNYPPTVREIVSGSCTKSTSHARAVVERLVRKGLVLTDRYTVMPVWVWEALERARVKQNEEPP